MEKNRVKILEGPAFEAVVKNLLAMRKKPLLKFVVDGRGEIDARVFAIRDSGSFDTDENSESLIVSLTWEPVNGYAHATATYFTRTDRWGVWTYLPDD